MIEYYAITSKGRKVNACTLTALESGPITPHQQATRSIRRQLDPGEGVVSLWIRTPWMEEAEYEPSEG